LLHTIENETFVLPFTCVKETEEEAVALLTGAEKTYLIWGRNLILNKSLPGTPSTLLLRTDKFGTGRGGGGGVLPLSLPQQISKLITENKKIKLRM
jgi:hypothetical protein